MVLCPAACGSSLCAELRLIHHWKGFLITCSYALRRSCHSPEYSTISQFFTAYTEKNTHTYTSYLWRLRFSDGAASANDDSNEALSQ
eukprot:scaffold152508_cov19-Prasinocladus_malaysianus.AAC.1